MSEPTWRDLPAARSDVANGTMNPRAAIDEKILRALTEAFQRVFDETGVRVDFVNVRWDERDALGNRLKKTVVGKIDMRSTKTLTVKD